jgi:polyhydroxybutyrate depolymerase
MLRLTYIAMLVACCALLVNADEPRPAKGAPTESPKVESGSKDDDAKPGKGRFAEILKKLKSKDAPTEKGDAPAGPEGKLGGRLGKLKGQGEPLDMTKFKKVPWTVGEDTREAIVYAPPAKDKSEKRPLVFAFHGHGGTAERAAKRIVFHELWPDAVSVYPQGLATATDIDPTGRLPGWQKTAGVQSDRDLAFFDAMLKTMVAEHQVDPNRVYACGHSNGGYFCYLLFSTRSDALAAIAPVAASLNVRDLKDLKPKPVFHVAGERDPLVKYAWQEKTLEQLRKVNGCDQPAGEHCTEFSSKNGPPVVAYLHSGGHEIPAGSLPRITEFFQKQTRK